MKAVDLALAPGGKLSLLYREQTGGKRSRLRLEFTLDAPSAEQINAERVKDARATLKRWLAGDHTSNNTYRSDHA